jgi:RNA polymerase sigma factor for flagellar operon FliA
MERKAALERERTIRRFFPLVHRIAKRVQRIVVGSSLDDLTGDGSVGLIRSVDTYDPSLGYTFESYARKVIVGSMLNGLRRMDPIPERVRRRVRRAEEMRYKMAQERGALPSMLELERCTPGLQRARMLVFRYTPLSLDGPLLIDESGLLDLESDPVLTVVERSLTRELLGAVRLLPERQRRVVVLHYYQRLSLHAIGAKVGVTPQRVSQLHLSALQTLRSRAAAIL